MTTREVKICAAPPGELCHITQGPGHECLSCQLQIMKGDAGLLKDQYRTMQQRIERAMAFEKSEAERQRLETEVEGWAKRIASLVKSCGKEQTCRGATCEKTIYFITTKAGRQAPYDLDGTTHFATCPDSKTFQKGHK